MLQDSACNACRVQCYVIIDFSRVNCLLVDPGNDMYFDPRNDIYFLIQCWKISKSWLLQASLDYIFTAFSTLNVTGVRRREPLDMSRPGQPGWVGFRDLSSRSPLFSSEKIRFFQMRSRAVMVTEISDFATEISVMGMKNFPYERSSPGDRDETFFWQNSFAIATSQQKWHNSWLVCFPLQW